MRTMILASFNVLRVILILIVTTSRVVILFFYLMSWPLEGFLEGEEFQRLPWGLSYYNSSYFIHQRTDIQILLTAVIFISSIHLGVMEMTTEPTVTQIYVNSLFPYYYLTPINPSLTGHPQLNSWVSVSTYFLVPIDPESSGYSSFPSYLSKESYILLEKEWRNHCQIYLSYCCRVLPYGDLASPSFYGFWGLKTDLVLEIGKE